MTGPTTRLVVVWAVGIAALSYEMYSDFHQLGNQLFVRLSEHSSLVFTIPASLSAVLTSMVLVGSVMVLIGDDKASDPTRLDTFE